MSNEAEPRSNKNIKLEIEKLNDQEREALFGAPTKFTKSLASNMQSIPNRSLLVNHSNINSLFKNYVEDNISKEKGLSLFDKGNFYIHADNKLKSVWDIFILLLIGYTSITTSFEFHFYELELLSKLSKP